MLGRLPTNDQLAAHLELFAGEVCEGLQASRANQLLRLDAAVADERGDGEATLADSIGGVDGGYDLVDAGCSLSSAMRQLADSDRRLLSFRFGEGLAQRQIGERIGVSQMQVSRLLRAALARLREPALGEAVDAGGPSGHRRASAPDRVRRLAPGRRGNGEPVPPRRRIPLTNTNNGP